MNPTVDSKGPLKGKGTAGLVDPSVCARRWQIEARDRLDGVHRQMRQLAAETRSIEGRTFGLVVCARRCTRVISRQLRWRARGGKHMLWEAIEPQLATMSWVLAQWYRRAGEFAVWLNHRERAARQELGHALALPGRLTTG